MSASAVALSAEALPLLLTLSRVVALDSVAHVLDHTGASCWPSTCSSRGYRATVCPRGKPEIRPLRPAGCSEAFAATALGLAAPRGLVVAFTALTSRRPPRHRTTCGGGPTRSRPTNGQQTRQRGCCGPPRSRDSRSRDKRRRHRGVDARIRPAPALGGTAPPGARATGDGRVHTRDMHGAAPAALTAA